MRGDAVAVQQRDADAALEMKDLLALDVLQAAHQLEHFRRGGARFVARHVAHEHDELVAAEPSDEILGTHRVAQLLSGELEQVVAGRVAARVVDVLELVEVDEEQRAARAGVGATRQLGLELGDEPMAVREARELIVIREMQQPALALLQRPSRVLEGYARSRAAPCTASSESERPAPPTRAARASARAPIAARARSSRTNGRTPMRRRGAAAGCRSRRASRGQSAFS